MDIQTNSLHSFSFESAARNGHASAEAIRASPDLHLGIQGGFKPVQMPQFNVWDSFRHIDSVFRKVIGKGRKRGRTVNGSLRGSELRLGSSAPLRQSQ